MARQGKARQGEAVTACKLCRVELKPSRKVTTTGTARQVITVIKIDENYAVIRTLILSTFHQANYGGGDVDDDDDYVDDDRIDRGRAARMESTQPLKILLQ